jgi:TonB family protein
MIKHALVVLLLVNCASAAENCVSHAESLEYPQIARLARIEGEVVLDIKVAQDGKVLTAKAVSGHQMLKRAAEENIRKWVFDSKTTTDLRFTYVFKLELPEVNYLPPPKMILDLPEKVTVISRVPARDH